MREYTVGTQYREDGASTKATQDGPCPDSGEEVSAEQRGRCVLASETLTGTTRST